MKWLVTIILFFFICTSASALNKYVDSTGGSLSGNGNSPGTAYKSIAQVNAIMGSLNSGDSILLKRGEYWNIQLLVKTGIHVGAYGSGSEPLISGFTAVTGWTNVSGNIWQSAAVTGTNTGISMVTMGGIAKAMGRWPNTNAANGGYAVYDSMASLTAIRSVTAMPFDFTGATLCMRKIADILGRETVTSVSGTTINHVNLTGANYKGFDGFGYFIENSMSTLDAQNEWYFNPSTRRLFIYSTTIPTNVKISTIDTLVAIGAFDNVTFNNISFEGADKSAINIGRTGVSIGVQIKYCNFDNSGRDAIYATSNTDLVVQYCYFNHSLNNAVIMANEGGNTINANVSYNNIKNTGYLAGMGFLDYAAGYKFSMEAITNGTSAVAGQLGMTAKFNRIDTVGHIGIRFFQNNTFIDSNYINYHNFVTDDAGGINAFDNFTGLIEINRTIIGNIITNGIGAGLGSTGFPVVNGIYIDDKADGITIRRNFVGNISWVAGSFDGSTIYVHNGTNLNILLNVCYNGGYAQLTLAHDGNAVGFPMRNINVQNNLFFSKVNTARFVVTRTRLPASDMDSIYNPINNNRYWRPTLITGSTFQTVTNYKGSPQTVRDFTFPLWQSAYPPYDVNSTQGGSNTGATDFVCNFSDHDSTLNFSGLSYLVPQYNSPYQIVYNNSMIMAPYTGYIRVANGSVAPINKFPVANSGGDVVITLPVDFTNLIGTGSDTDGVIVSYAWTQLSGPNTAVITPPSSLTTGTTNVSNLIQGIYQFQIIVTDNNGATGTAIARVTVNAAIPNTPPTVNAGSDQGIQLPVNSTSVTATFTNGSGTSGNIVWSQIGTIPSVATINSPTSATTTLSNLDAVGTYTFKVVYKNNLLDSATDQMQVIVSPAVTPPNQPPVANIVVTPSINITLPTNSVVLDGTGSTDPEGGALTYVFTQTSGPTTATNSTPTGSSTTMGNLSVGQYIFNLTVKDVGDSTGTISATITVNAATILTPPTANVNPINPISLPVNFVTLTGSGTDGSGTINFQEWTLISGPGSGGDISTPNNYTTLVSNLVEGTYIFQLEVRDTNGLSGTGLIQVIVRPVLRLQSVLLRGYGVQ